MAAGDDIKRRRRHHGDGTSSIAARKRKSSTRKRYSHKASAAPSGDYSLPATEQVKLDELRKLRVDYHTKPPEQRSRPTMRYIYEPRESTKPKSAYVGETSTMTRHNTANDSERGRRHKKRRRYEPELDDDAEYVYSRNVDDVTKNSPPCTRKTSTNVSTSVSRKSPREDVHTTGKTRPTVSRAMSGAASSTRTVTREMVTPQRRRSEPPHRSDSHRRLEKIDEDCEPIRAYRTTSTREAMPSRPPRRQSSTSMRTKTPSVRPSTGSRSHTEPPKYEGKAASLFGSLFGGGSHARTPEKLMTCLTCLSDDIPLSKSAKLACAHYMCHDCLRRIFELSVTDPAHMPPRCCSEQHIPLKHVEKLFNMKFKEKWNRKYQEYTTRSRIYCPTRGCGEWIKPSHISTEYGRKVGTCKRCHTRVCCMCNNRMHKSRECPKDEATKKLIETAQKEGWQRCYDCRAMVELKEGCNHMTCRCTAQFCMICGLKWKSCDCPWFNYDAVEADRLMHMNIPQARQAFANGQGRGPLRYQQELDMRQEQERRDEDLARRLQGLGLDGADDAHQNNVNNPPVEIIGIGNAGDHFMNQDFVNRARNILTGNVHQAQRAADALLSGNITGRENPLPPAPFEFPPPNATRGPIAAPQLLRHHSTASRAYNASPNTRPSERIVPARRTTDYATEAARHDPAGPAATTNGNTTARGSTRAGAMIRRNTAQIRRTTGTGSRSTAAKVSNLIGRPDPAEQETDARIENWRNGVVAGSEV